MYPNALLQPLLLRPVQALSEQATDEFFMMAVVAAAAVVLLLKLCIDNGSSLTRVMDGLLNVVAVAMLSMVLLVVLWMVFNATNSDGIGFG